MAAHAAVVEAKVKSAAVATYLVSVAALAIVNAVTSDASLLGPLPDWAEALVVPVLPAAAAFLAGWNARHTPRPDLPPAPPE
jgi:VIT1/CCC1 family predicted Fe2+/Mn2+ transporter